MDASITRQILMDGIQVLSTELFIIFGTLITVIIGIYVFQQGLYIMIHDKSLNIGGFYLRNTPYKGYNRWRSKNWNMEHTL